jgi:hypothetical protein
MRLAPQRPVRRAAIAAGTLAVAAASLATALPSTASASPAASPHELTISSTGLPGGAIKHVWLIILENKSYDATFTGLNKNSYLWQTLPQQGVLLKNYYGTGHFSQDNYESMVSGQAPQLDTQSDCDAAATNFSDNTHIESTGGSLAANPNYGQTDSTGLSNPTSNPAKGTGYTPAPGNVAYNPDGSNGCVYPSNVPTLFNQLDAAGKTWKGYAQDLGKQPGRDDGACGYPGTATNTPDSTTIGANPTAGPTRLNDAKDYPGVASFTGTQAAGTDAHGVAGALEDGYVAKHFPFPWFHSLIDGTTTPADGGTDCDANHIANLDSQTQGLVHDLKSESTTPAFSWITPNNCSDAHDAICKGNNLSGAFTPGGDPDYSSVSPAFDPQNTTPTNYTGGLYASDLFLKWYVPLIEQSAAFKDGGLIDVTFDEGNPPFAGSSFNNANDPAFSATNTAPGVSDPANLSTYLAVDAAGQNINGVDVNTEPTGPNTPVTVGGAGSACTATPCSGPGDAGFIHRVAPGSAVHAAAAAAASGSSTILDNSIAATDVNRTVTGTGIPINSFVGPVSQTGPLFPVTNTGVVTLNQFQLVDAAGVAVATTGAVSGITLGAQSTDSTAKDFDPIYDPTDFTPGGGNTGSVLISPYIKPGTSTTTYYNHYSWLRTMEDLFAVGDGSTTTALTPGAGSVSGGLDGAGHLGYAAQDGLRTFGPDVFTNAPALPADAPSPTVIPGNPGATSVARPSPLAFPTITGSLQTGQVATCGPGSWSGSPTFGYQWLRTGVPIGLATAATYTLTPTDFGRVVTCRVAATNSAGSVQALASAFLPVAGPKLKVGRSERFTGTTKVGQTLRAKNATTSPATTSVTYQWLRAGQAIAGATKSSYKLTSADRGHSIGLRATLLSTGYTSTTSASKTSKIS